MDDNERRRYDMFVRVRQFGVENAADFPAGSVGATQFAAVSAEIDQLDSFGTDPAVGFGEARQAFETKDTARENRTEPSAFITDC